MSALADYVLQGLHAGDSAASSHFSQAMQLAQMARQAAEREAARRGFLDRWQSLNPAPSSIVQEQVPDGMMGPPVGVPNPEFERWQNERDAFAQIPPQYQHEIIGQQEMANRQMKVHAFLQTLDDQEAQAALTTIKRAKEVGLGPSDSPDVAAAYKKLKIVPPVSTEMMQGVMQGHPDAMAGFYNTTGHVPPMPKAQVPQDAEAEGRLMAMVYDPKTPQDARMMAIAKLRSMGRTINPSGALEAIKPHNESDASRAVANLGAGDIDMLRQMANPASGNPSVLSALARARLRQVLSEMGTDEQGYELELEASRAEKAAKEAGKPGFIGRNLGSSTATKNAKAEEARRKADEYRAQRGGGAALSPAKPQSDTAQPPRTVQGPSRQDKMAVVHQVIQDHPDWSDEDVAAEVDRRLGGKR